MFLPFTWKTVKKLADTHTIFLSHHRKTTLWLMMFKILLGKRLTVVHVAHNTFTNLRMFCLFPETVIAVSNGVKENLMDYFRIPEKRIKVVFNGLTDMRNHLKIRDKDRDIRILLPGRICPVKQQVELIRRTKGKLLSYIHIYFAGTGEDVELLKKEIGDSLQYHYIGFIDMAEQLNQYDYVCLFSQKEGLGLSLVEGLMFGKPLITNLLPAVLDVNEAGKTGFAYGDFDSLITGLNQLPFTDSEEYKRMSLNARKRYDDYFMEETMINNYRAILNDEIDKNNM